MRLICIAMLFFSSYAQGGTFYDGNKLNELILADQREDAGRSLPGDPRKSGRLSGYIVGIAEGHDGTPGFCLPEGVTVGQLVAVVSRSVQARPERWNEPAWDLVYDALKKAFPCKAR